MLDKNYSSHKLACVSESSMLLGRTLLIYCIAASKKEFPGTNPMAPSAPEAESSEVIALHPVK